MKHIERDRDRYKLELESLLAEKYMRRYIPDHPFLPCSTTSRTNEQRQVPRTSTYLHTRDQTRDTSSSSIITATVAAITASSISTSSKRTNWLILQRGGCLQPKSKIRASSSVCLLSGRSSSLCSTFSSILSQGRKVDTVLGYHSNPVACLLVWFDIS